MTPKEVLIAAKALIDTPEKWNQGAYCQDGRYCAQGAIVQASGVDISGGARFVVPGDSRPWIGAYETMLDVLIVMGEPSASMFAFNDTHSHVDVMAWFDRAIEAAGES